MPVYPRAAFPVLHPTYLLQYFCNLWNSNGEAALDGLSPVTRTFRTAAVVTKVSTPGIV